MNTRTSLASPVPELPVVDVERAQQHYRDVLEPAVHWIFAPDIDATYNELRSSGANIVEPLEKKPWGLRQFTLEHLDGNRFYIHHD